MIAEPQSDLLHSKAMPDLIVKLLAERQEVLVLLNELVQLKPYREAARVQPVLQQFCQVLVDYVALGHFEVYQCIDDNAS
ncbi:MAG: Rsd/AlgQ family anti-sigma factor, partial [Candidatus Competibacteraceae bacterium]|nr:Rsd/AlgQ family anti-sigma factor [Candidatus Competibacteraceae bacterium]